MLPHARIVLHRAKIVVEEYGGVDACKADEVQEFHVVHDVLYGIAAAVGEVDAEGLLEESSAVLVGKGDDDGGKRMPEDDFLDDGVAEIRLHDRADGIDGDVFEEEAQAIHIEVPGRVVHHHLIDDVRFVCPFVGAHARQRIVDVGDGGDAAVRVDGLAVYMIGIA